MRWFDIGAEAEGFVAVGQFATGVFAFGQVATGVVAVGQVAFGVVAIGQGALGLVTFGMAAGGLHFCVAMVGVGGRGIGWVAPLLPSLGDPVELPPRTTFAQLTAPDPPERQSGWVEVVLAADQAEVAIYDRRVHRPDVRLDARLRRSLIERGPGEYLAQVQPDRDGWIVDRLMEIPVHRLLDPQWWLVWALQLIGMAALAILVWWLAIDPLLVALFSP